MHPITNYIKERMKFIEEIPKNIVSDDLPARIRELQAVLSKLEELDKYDWIVVKWKTPHKS